MRQLSVSGCKACLNKNKNFKYINRILEDGMEYTANE